MNTPTIDRRTGEPIPEWEDLPEFCGLLCPFWARVPMFPKFHWDGRFVELSKYGGRAAVRLNMSLGRLEFRVLSGYAREGDPRNG